MSGAPTMETVFAALVRLRESQDALDRAHDGDYRVIDAWLRAHGSIREQADDVIQQTLLSVARSVSGMEATTAKAALRWLRVVRSSRGRDALRASLRDPVSKGVANDDERMAIERLPARAEQHHSRQPLLDLFHTLEEEVDRASDQAGVRVTLRHLRRVQARVALHRVVLAADLDELTVLARHEPPPSKEQIYKWVERGRAVLLAALEGWREREPEQADVAEALAELLSERRADAGVARGPRPRQDA